MADLERQKDMYGPHANEATAADLGYGGIKIGEPYVGAERMVSPRVDVRRTGKMLQYTRWICGQRHTFQVGGTPERPEYVWVWRNGESIRDFSFEDLRLPPRTRAPRDPEPVDPVAWLRSLPLGTVLLALDFTAWQVRTCFEFEGNGPLRSFAALQAVGSDPFELALDEDVDSVLENGPFTVIWMPPVGV